MIDKGVIVGSAVLAVSSLLGQVPVPQDASWVSSVSNLTATGAVIYLVIWTIPQLAKEFREERKMDREEMEKNRQKFRCHAAADD